MIMVNSLSGWRRLMPRLHAKPRQLHSHLHSCLLCEGPAAALPLCNALCHGCHQDLPWNNQSCARCALPLASGQRLCAACLQHPPAQVLTLAPLCYEFPVDHLVAGLKYHGQLAHAPLLGNLLKQHVIAANLPAPDLLLPVPLHSQRLAERGYNQALEIARPLAKHFALPLETKLIIRQKSTTPQMLLSAEARALNPQGAFALDEKRLRQLGEIQRVAIIDDVMTTGATLAEITRLLMNAGILHVELWVVARTP
jgi:ComF family protein